MSDDRRNCPCCMSHDVTQSHIDRCQHRQTHRTAAEAHGTAQGIPAVTTADLWAHLGHVAFSEDATRIVRQVINLGWRPVVGSDPRRLWTMTAEPTAPHEHEESQHV